MTPTQYDADMIRNLPADEAVKLLDILIKAKPEDENLLVLRGEKNWALNRREEAVNDYLAALKINPEGKAKMLLEYTRSILDFYNKDLLNP